ncbi:carbohydrate ABC transporter permease [Aurantimicrobium minutum]|uniref:carbohydrate ABC transporter permease n=1 Tax=Aurantimicrobium minutum TaxID=708131 RepID=UPI00247398B9|nr:carbohydrate ABC transporter permease [Aurantimicrobium minutum]
MAPSPKPLKAKKVELKKRGISGWIVFAILAISTLAWLLPFYMALINSVKTESEFVNGGPLALPMGFDLTNVIDFWNAVDFPRKLWNSVISSLSGALIAIVLSLFTAFAIGIGRVRGRFWILALFMIAFTIPQEALIYPFYNMAKSIGLYDSLLSVIIIYAVLSTAFGTYMLSSVLNEFPEEMLEAAKIDGATTWTILSQIVFPLLRPTLLVLFTFFFIYNWNEFLIPLVLLPSNDNQTVTVGLGVVFGQWTTDPTQLAAAALLGSLPSIIFFFIFQKSLMRGVTMGSTK